jgi:hypothetical protein
MPGATQTSLDARIDLAAWLADKVSIEFAEQEGAAFANGDGINKPRGILAYSRRPILGQARLRRIRQGRRLCRRDGFGKPRRLPDRPLLCAEIRLQERGRLADVGCDHEHGQDARLRLARTPP